MCARCITLNVICLYFSVRRKRRMHQRECRPRFPPLPSRIPCIMYPFVRHVTEISDPLVSLGSPNARRDHAYIHSMHHHPQSLSLPPFSSLARPIKM